MAEVGRPTKLTDEVRKKMEEVAALDGTVEEMAYYCDVSRQTIYQWLKDDPEFSDRIERLRERPILKARQTITKSLETPQGAQWYLSRKKKKEFAERLEQTGADGKELPQPIINVFRDNSDPEGKEDEEANQGDTGGNLSV